MTKPHHKVQSVAIPPASATLHLYPVSTTAVFGLHYKWYAGMHGASEATLMASKLTLPRVILRHFYFILTLLFNIKSHVLRVRNY
jgi:hypothetical protein